jgi:hypothetical protein
MSRNWSKIEAKVERAQARGETLAGALKKIGVPYHVWAYHKSKAGDKGGFKKFVPAGSAGIVVTLPNGTKVGVESGDTEALRTVLAVVGAE